MTMWVGGVLRRERAIVATCLALLCVLAWLYLLAGAGMTSPVWGPATANPDSSMTMGEVRPGGVDWPTGLWLTTIAMWWTMMVAMMTPSAAPTILLFDRVHRKALGVVGEPEAAELAPTGAFAAGYLLIWLGFSVLAATLHWALQDSGLISSHAMASQSRRLSAAIPIVAGLYQFTPAQALCLRHCRAPADFLTRHWSPGPAGALRLGVRHGAYCAGCCWTLMLLLFVGGVMNLAWIAALSLLVAGQKLVHGGFWIARAVGLALIAWGLWSLVGR
jgi:predicted metal-binding membrane protein